MELEHDPEQHDFLVDIQCVATFNVFKVQRERWYQSSAVVAKYPYIQRGRVSTIRTTVWATRDSSVITSWLNHECPLHQNINSCEDYNLTVEHSLHH